MRIKPQTLRIHNHRHYAVLFWTPPLSKAKQLLEMEQSHSEGDKDHVSQGKWKTSTL